MQELTNAFDALSRLSNLFSNALKWLPRPLRIVLVTLLVILSFAACAAYATCYVLIKDLFSLFKRKQE